jgi:hypothetical protein
VNYMSGVLVCQCALLLQDVGRLHYISGSYVIVVCHGCSGDLAPVSYPAGLPIVLPSGPSS